MRWRSPSIRPNRRPRVTIEDRAVIEVIHPEAEYAGFVSEGRLMLQRVVSTGELVFFPRVAQPGTGRSDLEWVEAAGQGTVYSYTIMRNKPPAALEVIALIDLVEGVRLMSRVVDCDPAAVRIGMGVRAKAGEVDGAPAILFAPAEALER
jgi:uncharacterized protein